MRSDRDFRPWSDPEDQRLTGLLASGLGLKECAEKLKRSYRAVQCHLDQHPHLRPQQAQPRRAWSTDEDAQLLRALKSGRSKSQIAEDLALRLGRPPKGILMRLQRLRNGRASTAGRMGRPAQAQPEPDPGPKPELTYRELARRHRISVAEVERIAAKLVAEAEHQAAYERGDLYRIWCRLNDAVAARNAALAAGGESC